MCPQGHNLMLKKGFMSYDLFTKIIDQVASTDGYQPKIGLHMNGEPLLHKGLADMILYASKHGLYTLIHTNGTLMTPEMARELINSGISEVSFSFEGENPQRYENIRLNAKYDEVRQNIKHFIRIKGQTRVIIEVLKFRGIDPGISISEHFKNEFHGAEFSSFYASNWHGSLDLPELNEKDICLESPSVCGDMKKVLPISWDGKAHSCCIDFNSLMVIGDMNENSIQEVWFGEKRKKILKLMIAGKHKSLELCQTCNAPYTVETKQRKLETLVVT